MFQSLYEPNQTVFLTAIISKESKLTTGLRLDLNHLRKHNFKNSFQVCLKQRLTGKIAKRYVFKHQK